MTEERQLIAAGGCGIIRGKVFEAVILWRMWLCIESGGLVVLMSM